MLKRAARTQERTMTVVTAVQEAALWAIEQAEVVRLSLADQECFAWAFAAEACARLEARFRSPSQVESRRVSRASFLADALARAACSDVAAYALVADAKDASAVVFYRIGLTNSSHCRLCRRSCFCRWQQWVRCKV